MTERVKKLRAALDIEVRPLCVEKLKYMIPSLRKSRGLPEIVRRAQAVADYLDNRTIFIQPDELIVGTEAAKPMGMELSAETPPWDEAELNNLADCGSFSFTEEDRKVIRESNSYWSEAEYNDTEGAHKGFYYDDERLWPFNQRGFLCPPFLDKKQGRGYGLAGSSLGFHLGTNTLLCHDYAHILSVGFDKTIDACEEELRNLRFVEDDSLEKADYYKAALIALPAVVRFVRRYSTLAKEMATQESDPVRKAELEQIAETCWNIPAKPAATFREAIQFFWFYWLIQGGAGVTPGGRFDQYMYPYYKADLEAGRITPEEAYELICCLRLKISEVNVVFAAPKQREKWSGNAKWHNFILGGIDRDGNDVTNPLSFMMLDAAAELHTPHPTLTVRVNDKMNSDFYKRAIEVASMGMGMPAFISEQGYINCLIAQGVDPIDARDFAIAGCLDIVLPGKSRNNGPAMLIVPMILELALYNGCDPVKGHFFGKTTGEFTEFKTYDEFYDAFLEQLRLIAGLVCEENNIVMAVNRRWYPNILTSVFFHDGIKCGRDALARRLPFDNSSIMNAIGMINTADSLVAIKKLVFDDKTVSAETMLKALRANWEGYEDIRELCLKAPKYGNNDAYADEVASRLYKDYSDIVRSYTSIFGAPMMPAGISITTHAPGGSMTTATPDGRYNGETLADGSVSPEQGMDINGPIAMLNSAMKLDQDTYTATLLNMKFHPSTLQSDADKEKLGVLIKTYLTHGGRHLQFNVVDANTLKAAQQDKEAYKDLIIRVAGYSTYFVSLSNAVQDEVIKRTENYL